MALKELATELGVTVDALTKFFLRGIPNIEISEQEIVVAKLIDARDAAHLQMSEEIVAAQSKLAQMCEDVKNLGA